jgi:acetyl esterase/lipase
MMRPLAMRGRTGWRPGWRVAAATGVLTALSLAVAPLAASASGAAAVATSAGRAAAVKPASTLPTCPSTQYSYTETREAYGTSTDGQGLDVDEYLPAKSASGSEPPPTVPGVVMVHGGEWIEGNFEGGEGTSTTAGDGLSALAECFAENGYDAFSIDYALTGSFDGVSELSFPQNLQDIQSAITYVKANAGNLETSKILILGQSAGGNLAALAGENAMGISDGLAGVLSQSGPTDLTALGNGCTNTATCPAGSVGGIVHNYLGCYATSTSCTLQYTNKTTTVSGQAAYGDASPASQLSATVPAPPFLLFNSSDEIIPLAQGTGMAQALSNQCTATKGTTSTELVAVPGDQHASTYTDIVSGPELDFVNAVTGGTLPGGCTIASPLTGASVAYDAAAGAKSLIGFGGCCTASGTLTGTTEVYKASTGTWKPVTITGTAPPARLGATFGWDQTSGDLVLFGGEYLPGGTAQPEALNDTWELSYTASTDTGTWTQVDTGTGCPTACPGAPAARYAAGADEAPRDQGLVLFGGESVVPADQAGAPATYGDTWLWNGTSKTWTALNPAGASGVDPRYGQVLAYYGPKNLDLMFGGNQGASTSFCNKNGSCLDPLNDTWELTYNATAGTWAWTSAGTAPGGLLARVFAAGASSATGVTIFGGLNGSGNTGGVVSEQLLGDTWTWSSTSGWSQPCNPCSPAPPPGDGPAMAYQRAAAEGFLYGGYTDTAPPAAPASTWIWTGTAWQT